MTTRPSFLVSFQDVGGGKMTWQEVLPDLSHQSLLKAVKDRRAVVSRFPEFDVREDGKGSILAGWRVVGSFEWKEQWPVPIR